MKAAFWPLIMLALCATAIVIGWESPTPPAPYVNVQTCVYSSEDTGSKLGNICSRLDPDTHWSLRQRI